MGQLLAILSCDSTSLNLITWHALSGQAGTLWMTKEWCALNSPALMEHFPINHIQLWMALNGSVCVRVGATRSASQRQQKAFTLSVSFSLRATRVWNCCVHQTGGLSKLISLRERAYVVTFQSIFKVLLAPDRRWGGGEEKQRKTPNMVWQPALIRPSFFFFCHPTVPACSQRNSSDENELKISVYSCWCCSKPVWILKNIDEKNLTDEGSLSCSYSEIILWPGRVKIQNRDTLWNERESAIKLVRNLSEIFAR